MNEQRPADRGGQYVQVEQITAPGPIAHILARVKEGRLPLSVRVPGSLERFASLVLELNAASGYLVLDELMPQTGQDLLLRAGRFEAWGKDNGVDFSFAGNVLQTGRQGDAAWYRVSLPKVIKYFQRRAYYRVHVGMALGIMVLLHREQAHDEVKGQLCNISIGGLSARLHQPALLPPEPEENLVPGIGVSAAFPYDLSPGLQTGEIIPDCRIRAQRDDEIICGLEVRHIVYDPAHKLTRVGGQFIGLDRAQQKRLGNFVIKLERELRRKMPKG